MLDRLLPKISVIGHNQDRIPVREQERRRGGGPLSADQFYELKGNLLDSVKKTPEVGGAFKDVPEIKAVIDHFTHQCPDLYDMIDYWPTVQRELLGTDLSPDSVASVNQAVSGFLSRNLSKMLKPGSRVVSDAERVLCLIDFYFDESGLQKESLVIAPNETLGIVYPPFPYFSSDFQAIIGLTYIERSMLESLDVESVVASRVVVLNTYLSSFQQADCRTIENQLEPLFRLARHLGGADIISVDHSKAAYTFRLNGSSAQEAIMEAGLMLAHRAGMSVSAFPGDFSTVNEEPQLHLFNANANPLRYTSEVDNQYPLLRESAGFPLLIDQGRKLVNSAEFFKAALAARVEEEYQK